MRRVAVGALAVALALASCSSSPDTADTIDPVPSSSTDTTEPAADAAAIELLPVLAGPQPCDTPGAIGTTVPIQDVPEAGCFEVGPVGVDGTDLARAEAVPGGSTGTEWMVEVEVAESARAAANAVFDACFENRETCPTALLAIVVDDAVVSAPSVADRGLADAPFVINGGRPDGFTRDEAEALADRISP